MLREVLHEIAGWCGQFAVHAHCGLGCAQGQDSDTTELQAAFDDLFMQYQVDFTTYGHVHTYAR